MKQFSRCFRLGIVASLVCFGFALSAFAQKTVSIPDSPAGKQLNGFLAAVNSGQRRQ
jgi:hypothetical protein